MRTLALAALLAASLAACSTTSTVHRPHTVAAGQQYSYSFTNENGPDHASEVAELDRMIRHRLDDAGLLGNSDHRIQVTLSHYYVRSNAKRFWAGIMAGRDKVSSTVQVFDASGTEVGRFDVESVNSTAMGSRETLLTEHAGEIVARLTGRVDA